MNILFESEVGYLLIMIAGGLLMVVMELIFAVAGRILRRKQGNHHKGV